jgi:hypothetical protein
MLPTMYLRLAITKEAKFRAKCYALPERPIPVLQQWCYTNDETGGPPVYLDETKLQELMRGEEVEGGAWRDVPIVEDV